MYPPPYVDPAQLRPRRRWYVFAGVFAAVMVGLGVAGLVIGVVTAVRSVSLGEKFDSGQTVTVQYTGGETGGIYAHVAAPGSPVPTASACAVAGMAGPIQVSEPNGTFTTSTSSGGTWTEIATWHVPDTGAYRVACASPNTDRFSAGKAAQLGKILGGVAGGLGAFFGLGALGITVGTVVTVVVLVRRRRYRDQLLGLR